MTNCLVDGRIALECDVVNGSCLCGTVMFEIDGAISKLSHCHCSMCRKFHGALFATYFDSTGLTITQGEDAILSYASSRNVTRQFCKHCGSPLPEILNDDNNGVTVPVGLIDSKISGLPCKHIFVESKSAAYTITDNWPQVVGYGESDTRYIAPAEDIENTLRATSSGEPGKEHPKTHTVTGDCLCGAVSFEYEGAPEFVMNCHCSRCRKAKGAAHATNVFVTSDRFRWKTGEQLVESYAHPTAMVFGQAFCKTCGSSMPRKRPGAEMYNIPAGALNQPPGAEPKGHIYVGSKAPWFDITDNKPQWQKSPN